MEHAKKLMLVEPRFYRPTIGEKTLSGLDEEIRQTLNSDMPEDQKIKLYRMSLKKYMTYADNIGRIERGEEKKAQSVGVDEKDVLESIAIGERHKAKRLLDYLKRHPEAKVDHNGELTYRERHLPGSNVVDLIDNVLSETSIDQPEGWNEFVEILKEVNVPRTLIANQRLLRHAFNGNARARSPSPVASPRRKRLRRTELARLTAGAASPRKRSRSLSKKVWLKY